MLGKCRGCGHQFFVDDVLVRGRIALLVRDAQRLMYPTISQCPTCGGALNKSTLDIHSIEMEFECSS
jgi:hypothetical protein